MGRLTKFDLLFAEAGPLIEQRLHQRDSPPVEGGRWPVSVVLRPDRASADRLEATMVGAVPADENADCFMDLLKDELGDDAWYEAGFRRDIWYANILHLAADIAKPAELVAWVEQRRGLDLGRMVMDTAELVRFRYEDGADGRLMRPEVLATARTGGDAL